MTHLFLMYNMGNSGGTWFESVCNSHPEVHAWEEVTTRHLGLPKITAQTSRDAVEPRQQKVLAFLKEQEASGRWQSVGLIKAFRKAVLAHCLAHDARVVQQFRHPIKVIHGTRRRKLQPYRWLGREPKDKYEYFEGHVRWMAKRYRGFLGRADRYPVQTLEELSASLAGDRLFFRAQMEYVTRVEWDDEAIDRIPSPRHRREAVGNDRWREGYVSPNDAHAPFERQVDPPIEAIWGYWKNWQHELFLGCFERIMLTVGYTWP